MFLSARLRQLVGGALVSLALEANVSLASELKWTHFGVRPLAMGNAYVAVADDFNALFYNPAGLARLSEWDGEFFNPTVQISKNTLDTLQSLRGLAAGAGGDTDQVLRLLEDNTGRTQHASLGWTPHFVAPGFGFGIGAEAPITMAFHRDISVDLNFGPRFTVPFSLASNFFENRLSLGATIKMAGFGGINRSFSLNDIDAFSSKDNGSANQKQLKDYLQGGIGVGADFGLLFTPIETMSPTFGLSITDLGGTPFAPFKVSEESLGTPDARLPSVNTGISLVPWRAGPMYLRGAIDAHAINQPIHFSKKFNMGLEWGYGSLLRIQTGLHQGLLAGGFEFDVMLLTLRFATYTEQLGVLAGESEALQDRRYALQLKLLI